MPVHYLLGLGRSLPELKSALDVSGQLKAIALPLLERNEWPL